MSSSGGFLSSSSYQHQAEMSRHSSGSDSGYGSVSSVVYKQVEHRRGSLGQRQRRHAWVERIFLVVVSIGLGAFLSWNNSWDNSWSTTNNESEPTVAVVTTMEQQTPPVETAGVVTVENAGTTNLEERIKNKSLRKF